MSNYQFIGVDVAKDKFDVAINRNGKYLNATFMSDKKGLKSFLSWICQHADKPWVCMEATGHYSELIAEFLVVNEVIVSIANPMQIKNFLRSKLLRNKNDIVDARGITEYASVMPLTPFQIRPQMQKDLNDFNKLLETYKSQLVQLQNQLESMRGKKAVAILKKSINDLKKRIKDLEKAIEDLFEENQELNKQRELITSIPGIGNITAYQILGIIPDINMFGHAKQFAAFIGVSPRQNQSGKFVGSTTISKIGNARLRKAFYMASLTAKRFNPNLRGFVSRLEKKGKAPKSILCAVMRKLAHLVYSVLKNKRSFIIGF